MNAHGAKILLGGAAALLLGPMPATAQVPDGIVLNIMRECARIDDASARLACYDNNIRSAGAPPRASVPGSTPAPQGGSAPLASSGSQGFGSESVRQPRQSNPQPQGGGSESETRARVANVDERGPGVYLVTLESGAQWLFSESVPFAYSPPRRGSTVEIQRGALGSFRLRFDNQEPVPVRRVQ